jgi:hypothetical protein
MYFAKINASYTGFTNQIFYLITSIIIAYTKGHKVIVVDGFLNDISKTTYTPISQILNISEVNTFLKKTYDIIIVDKHDIKFELTNVKYGTKTNNIDLTASIIEKFYKDNKLYINKSTIFNDIQGDPCFGTLKNLFLTYKINEYIIEETHDERLLEDINIDFLNSHYIFTPGWINTHNTSMFEIILANIHYINDFLDKSSLILKDININNKVNVLHLRLEDDAIKHWSNMNGMSEHHYKEYIENKYIELIKKYISKTDQNIILSNSLSNRVINFLKDNNYVFKFSHKFFEDREKNAIVDLLISKYCNNIFIGNFNVANLNGSTFSYYIGKLIKNKRQVYIDLDHIYNDESVIDTYISIKQPKKNYIYIHVCCMNNWKEVFNDLIRDIKKSGLYNKIHEIRCNVLTESKDNLSFFNDEKIKIIGTSSNLDSFETTTLNLLHYHSFLEDFNVLYLHTKGIKHDKTEISNNIKDWVKYLSYFNIYKHDICINQLNFFDAVGVNLVTNPTPGGEHFLHYSGNFWWSHSQYIKKLGTLVYTHYNSPEVWLTETKIGNYLSLWNSNTNHYYTRYTEDAYVNKNIDIEKAYKFFSSIQ